MKTLLLQLLTFPVWFAMGLSTACGTAVSDSRGNVVWRSETDAKSAAKLAEQYLKNLFGEHAPTLESYRLYEGRTELEEIYEYVFCRMRWGSLTASECSSWMAGRERWPGRVPSIVYAAVRARLPFVGPRQHCKAAAKPPAPLSQGDIRVSAAEAQQWVFLCSGDDSTVVLEVRYAATDDSADFYLLHLASVNGLPLSTIVGVPCDGLGMNPDEFCFLLEPSAPDEREAPESAVGPSD